MRLNEKRGDITITLLVLGVVALCFFTIFIFANSGGPRVSEFSGVGLIKTMKSISQEQNLYENTDFTGSYSDSFEKDAIKIEISKDKITGTAKSLFSGKELVMVEYSRQ